MSSTLTDEMVEAALGDLDLAHRVLSAKTVVALRLADLLAGPQPAVNPAFYQEMKSCFSEGQILELASALTVASGWQRFIEAFGVRPDNPMPLRSLPD